MVVAVVVLAEVELAVGHLKERRRIRMPLSVIEADREIVPDWATLGGVLIRIGILRTSSMLHH